MNCMVIDEGKSAVPRAARRLIKSGRPLMACKTVLLEFEFADAWHHASYRDCEAMASFDDKNFARRANTPPVTARRGSVAESRQIA